MQPTLRRWLSLVLLLAGAAVLVAVAASLPVVDAESVEGPVSLNPENFEATIKKGIWIVEYFSPYCPHCQHFAPHFKGATKQLASERSKGLFFGDVDCTVHGELCKEHQIGGYPTVKLFVNGRFVEDYEKERQEEPVVAYGRSVLEKHGSEVVGPVAESKKIEEEPKKEEKAVPPPPPTANLQGSMIEMTDEDFSKSIKSGPWFVKFYAPWCGHCQRLAPTWAELGKAAKNKFNVGSVDCTKFKDICANNGVKGYPTLKFFYDGEPAEYGKGRKLEELLAFGEKAVSDPVIELREDEVVAAIQRRSACFLLVRGAEVDESLLEQYRNLARKSPSADFFITNRIPESLTRSFAPFDENAGELPSGSGPFLLNFRHREYTVYRKSLSSETELASFIQWGKVPLVMSIEELPRDGPESKKKLMILVTDPSSEDHDKNIQKAITAAKKTPEGWRFVWLDYAQHSAYARDTFGVQETPAMVAADLQEAVWFKVPDTKQGSVSSQEMLRYIAAVEDGQSEIHSMHGFLGGVARFMTKLFLPLSIAITENPITSALVIVGLFVALIWFLVSSGTDDDIEAKEDKRE